MSNIFENLTIAVSGHHHRTHGLTQSKLEAAINKHGAAFNKAVDDSTTHLITTGPEIEKRSAKVGKAWKQGIHIVSLDWLLESIDQKKKLPESSYALDPQDSSVSHTYDKREPKKLAKPDAIEAEDIEADGDGEPPAKKDKASTGTARATGNKRALGKLAKPDTMETKDTEAEPPAKKNKASTRLARVTGNKRASKKLAKSDATEAEDTEADGGEPPAKKDKASTGAARTTGSKRALKELDQSDAMEAEDTEADGDGKPTKKAKASTRTTGTTGNKRALKKLDKSDAAEVENAETEADGESERPTKKAKASSGTARATKGKQVSKKLAKSNATEVEDAETEADGESERLTKKAKASSGTARATKGKQASKKLAKSDAAEVEDAETEADGESERPTKKAKASSGTARATKGKQASRKLAKSDAAEVEDAETEADGESELPTKKAKASSGTARATKGKQASKKLAKSDTVEVEDAEAEAEADGGDDKMKTVIKKGRAPVDEMCSLAGTHHVYVDGDGVVWDATLNQTNIGNNNNKFYYLQLLEGDNANTYAVFYHWGRVGEKGQNQIQQMGLPQALKFFEKRFKDKTGRAWVDRAEAQGIPGKYAFLERNYEEDEDDDYSMKTKSEGEKVAPPPPDSKLAKPLQELMKLIFNVGLMQQSMASLSYDSKKLPLGKLSKQTILRGYEVLKMIGEVIANPITATSKYSEYGPNVLSELSSRYYTVIPHEFGRHTPPIITTPQMLKREAELVENLVDMKISSEIIKDSSMGNDMNVLDKQYETLGLNEAVALDRKSKEFKLLEAYAKKTHGQTHKMKLDVQEIFRIRRSAEEDRWTQDGWDSLKTDNRKLLWHGSRTTNFGGILSQGLRIAPPEAPVNGYMFGKGIYLADIVSKSANYCCYEQSANTGLLLLCEAQLGDPMFELHNADYNATENCKAAGRLATKGIGRMAPNVWEDASILNQELEGVSMPAVTSSATDLTAVLDQNAYLMYNEYIVYNVSQVKIRYLFRCKF